LGRGHRLLLTDHRLLFFGTVNLANLREIGNWILAVGYWLLLMVLVPPESLSGSKIVLEAQDAVNNIVVGDQDKESQKEKEAGLLGDGD